MGFSFRETHQPQESPQISSRSENNYLADITELQKLKDLILQRDNEISILFFKNGLKYVIVSWKRAVVIDRPITNC